MEGSPGGAQQQQQQGQRQALTLQEQPSDSPMPRVSSAPAGLDHDTQLQQQPEQQQRRQQQQQNSQLQKAQQQLLLPGAPHLDVDTLQDASERGKLQRTEETWVADGLRQRPFAEAAPPAAKATAEGPKLVAAASNLARTTGAQPPVAEATLPTAVAAPPAAATAPAAPATATLAASAPPTAATAPAAGATGLPIAAPSDTAAASSLRGGRTGRSPAAAARAPVPAAAGAPAAAEASGRPSPTALTSAAEAAAHSPGTPPSPASAVGASAWSSPHAGPGLGSTPAAAAQAASPAATAAAAPAATAATSPAASGTARGPSPPGRRSEPSAASLWRPQPSANRPPPSQQLQGPMQHRQQQQQQQRHHVHHEEADDAPSAGPRSSNMRAGSDEATAAAAAAGAGGGRSQGHKHHLNSAFVRSPERRRQQQQQQQQRQQRQQHASLQRATLSLVAPTASGGGRAAAANTLLLQGWLQKWTNLLSSWRPRYFFVYAGFFKYSTTKNSPPKEMFLLNQCRIRLCPHDPVRFEVDVVDQQTLYLRAESQEEKQMWYAAFKQGQRAALSGAHKASRSAAAAATAAPTAAAASETQHRDRQHPPQPQRSRQPEAAAAGGRTPRPASSSSSSSTRAPPADGASAQSRGPAAAHAAEATPTNGGSSSLSGLAGVVASGAAAAAAFATSRLRSLSAAALQQQQQQPLLLPSLPQQPPPPPPPPRPPPPQQQEQQQQQRHDGPRSISADAPVAAAAEAAGAAGPGEAAASVVGGSNNNSSSSSSPHVAGQVLQEGDGNSILDSTGVEGPLVLLLESIIRARQDIQETCSRILALQAQVLKSAAQITTPSGGSSLRQDVVQLLQRVDGLQQLLQFLLHQWERLLSEEYTQRRQLEKSVRSLAKRNYRLDKAQERLLQLSRQRGQLTPAEVAAALAGVRLPGAEKGEAAAADLDTAAAAAAAAAAADEGVGFTSSGSDEDEGKESLEFFDCDEELEEEEGGSRQKPLPAQQQVEQQVVAAAAAAAAAAGGVLGVAAAGDSASSSIAVGPPFSPAANAAVTLAALTSRFGGAVSGQRLALPKPRTEFKVNLWSILKDCIGRDLSRIAMPVYFNEPTSFLQRQCEDLQYADLLNLASRFPRSVDRLLAITVFAVSPYASAVGRTYKPFNPLLGETFELVHRGFRFLSEQVGHHPPVTAYVATAPHFSCEGWVTVRNRFSGKSLEVTMPGAARVTLIRTGDCFSYKRVKMLVHNVVWGKLWIEVDGTSMVQNETSGDFTVLQFLRKGWLDKTYHHFRAIVFDASGRPFYRLSGQWSSAIYVEEAPAFPPYKKWTVPPQVEEFRRSEAESADGPDNQLDAVISQYWDSIPWVESSKRLIWRPAARPPNADQFYGFGYFTMELNDLSEEYQVHAAPTDSRRRPDQRLYEEGAVDDAVAHKNRLEEKQRAAARARPRGEADYTPGWFSRNPQTGDWNYKGGYWEARESRDWNRCPNIF